MAPQAPDFSREVIVTSIGITIVQALDSIANEMKLTDVDIQALWSPFLAATTRLVKPADEMVATFLRESKTMELPVRVFGIPFLLCSTQH